VLHNRALAPLENHVQALQAGRMRNLCRFRSRERACRCAGSMPASTVTELSVAYSQVLDRGCMPLSPTAPGMTPVSRG
jgi:hypothetical protein